MRVSEKGLKNYVVAEENQKRKEFWWSKGVFTEAEMRKLERMHGLKWDSKEGRYKKIVKKPAVRCKDCRKYNHCKFAKHDYEGPCDWYEPD